ncbi:CGNR zinc finger domain-containing protein [Streptomyces parvulus]|uniref:CGNR zinc finger domain-containing protein n=1 Tax=Streptomyces parvulus TaxID=146923 RepID=UPI0036D1E670
MSWTSTERYRIRPAPGGLALVQELLNTRGITPYAMDALAEQTAARQWLRDTTAYWAGEHGWDTPSAAPADADVQQVMTLRDRLERMTAGHPPTETGPTTVTLTPALTADGTVTLSPQGSPGPWLEAAVWAEVLLAQHDHTWKRLKLCKEPQCRSAFYDRSRNNSGVWHDVRTCGNAANLRASRARRKAAPTPNTTEQA